MKFNNQFNQIARRAKTLTFLNLSLSVFLGLATWVLWSGTISLPPDLASLKTIITAFLGVSSVYGLGTVCGMIPIHNRIKEAQTDFKLRSMDDSWQSRIISSFPFFGVTALCLNKNGEPEEAQLWCISISSENSNNLTLEHILNLNEVPRLKTSVLLDKKNKPLLVTQENTVYVPISFISMPVLKL